MKWYHINFSEAELSALTDEKLIKDFIKLIHQLKHPVGLVIYELKSETGYGKDLFISSPDEFAYHVKKILAYFPSKEIVKPDLKELSPVIGEMRNE